MARLDQPGWSTSRAVPAFLALCVVLTAGCISSSDADNEKDKEAQPSVSASPSKSATLDPSEAAKAEALSAYKAYWTEVPKAFAVPAIEGTDLKRYAAAEALSKAEVTVANLTKNGRVMTGEPVVTNSTVTSAELEKKTPNVSVSSCLDVSNWKIIDKKTGQPAPVASSPVSKYVITSLLERWDGSWKVLKYDLHADQPC
ncbi:hypothetical protein PV721_42535 [Streptomyces sp. MB09-01]|uniref:hypothetical protein n=1 Tax=Streptomyces sp. MB09-01 TaxID=3028666 RepID=UPI0029B57F39|nr:hypothetical protein [Streptomyces sp. MB09-01]MDX3540850.1 hypothetical protein [Streptomyces sp. MB09-01]